MQRYLLSKGIQSSNHYPIPCHLQKPYKKFGYKRGDFPNSEKIANTQISLPIFPEIKLNMIEYVSKEINSWFELNR